MAGAAIGWARTTDEWIATDHAQRIGAVVQLDDPELGPTWMAGLPGPSDDHARRAERSAPSARRRPQTRVARPS